MINKTNGLNSEPTSLVGNTKLIYASIFISSVMMVVNMYLIFVWAPTERIMGHIQRIFYLHVPMAWLAFIAFFIVFVSGVLYLWKKDFKYDRIASSAAEIGVIFTTIVLITGPIWAKPIWGIWWSWDARLTTTLVLWMIYVGYHILRSYSSNRAQAATYSDIIGVIGFIDVPIVYFAVDWWRTQHQRLVVGVTSADGSLNDDMRIVLYFSLIAFTAFMLCLLWLRVSMKGLEMKLQSVKNNRKNSQPLS